MTRNSHLMISLGNGETQLTAYSHQEVSEATQKAIISWHVFHKRPENSSTRKWTRKVPENSFRCLSKLKRFSGPEKKCSFPKKFYGWSRAPKKSEKKSRKSLVNKKMAAVGALLTPTWEKRKYGQRTVLTGKRRYEVIEHYRLSPERTEWLISKFEGQLRRDTWRNALLDPEIQEGNFLFLWSSNMHCEFQLPRGKRDHFRV